MKNTRQKRIIHLSPGPIMAIDNLKFEALSKFATGIIFTSSYREEIIATKKVYAFKHICNRYNLDSKLISNLSFLVLIIKFAFKARKKRNSYDLITSYDPLKTGVFGVILAKILHSKLIVEVNGIYQDDAEYMDFSSVIYANLKKKIVIMIEKIVLKNAHGIKLLFPHQIDFFNIDRKKKIIRSFPNLVDIKSFDISGPQKNSKIILFVGFPFKRKGVDILIKAFKEISNEFPDWILKILGWFPDKTLLLKEIDNHSQIIYHEPVEKYEMPKHISECSIFVMPSRSEAMGRSLVEAMAAGKARIGSNVGGIPTVIDDGEDGLLFENGSIKDLASKLSILMSNEQLRQKLAQRSRIRAKKEFTNEIYFSNLQRFYLEVINS